MESRKTLRLIQQPYIEGYEGAFLHYVIPNTKESSPHGIWDNWYTAAAVNVDDEGDEYLIYWRVRDDYDVYHEQDESWACDWEEPYMIIDSRGYNVIDRIAYFIDDGEKVEVINEREKIK